MIRPQITLAALLLTCAWTVVGICDENAASIVGMSNTAASTFTICELYAPGHFGNSYEVLGDNEMRDVLAEAKFWGFGRHGAHGLQ